MFSLTALAPNSVTKHSNDTPWKLQVSFYLLGGEGLMVCCFLFQTGWDTTSSESESELESRRRALLKQLGAAGDDH